jgi:hypothetical protein
MKNGELGQETMQKTMEHARTIGVPLGPAHDIEPCGHGDLPDSEHSITHVN